MSRIISYLAEDIFTQVGLPGAGSDGNTTKTNFLSLFYTIAGVVALILIIWAAFTIVRAGDSADARKKGFKTITYVALGLFFILSATAIYRIILGLF